MKKHAIVENKVYRVFQKPVRPLWQENGTIGYGLNFLSIDYWLEIMVANIQKKPN